MNDYKKLAEEVVNKITPPDVDINQLGPFSMAIIRHEIETIAEAIEQAVLKDRERRLVWPSYEELIDGCKWGDSQEWWECFQWVKSQVKWE